MGRRNTCSKPTRRAFSDEGSFARACNNLGSLYASKVPELGHPYHNKSRGAIGMLTVLNKLRLGLAPKGCVPFVSAPLNIRIAFALRGNRSNVLASGKHLKGPLYIGRAESRHATEPNSTRPSSNPLAVQTAEHRYEQCGRSRPRYCQDFSASILASHSPHWYVSAC